MVARATAQTALSAMPGEALAKHLMLTQWSYEVSNSAPVLVRTLGHKEVTFCPRSQLVSPGIYSPGALNRSCLWSTLKGSENRRLHC